MSIDGTYDCELTTPMGILPVKMVLTTEGDTLTGRCSTPQGEQAITGKLPAPDEIAFSTRVKSPIGQVNLDVKGKVTGNEIAGQVKAGMFGKAAFKGKKI